MIFISNNQPSEILQPGKKAFNFPASPIAAKLSAILCFYFFPTFPMGRNHFNTALIKKNLIKPIAVICLIANKLGRGIFSKPAVDRRFNQLHLMRRSALNVSGDRKTRSVCDCHDLGALATLCLADSKAPFFAGTNVPSIKASRISMPPRSNRSCASSWAMDRKTPCFTHCWKRLWQVWYGGYLGGRSCQGAPVRNIHRIPFNTSRGSLGLRPLGSFGGVDAWISGPILFHCSFVSSILIILHNQIVMSSFIFKYFN